MGETPGRRTSQSPPIRTLTSRSWMLSKPSPRKTGIQKLLNFPTRNQKRTQHQVLEVNPLDCRTRMNQSRLVPDLKTTWIHGKELCHSPNPQSVYEDLQRAI